LFSVRRPKLLDRSVINEILAKSDLVALIGSHISLRKQGQHFIGLCPFHSERSPSFHVRQDRGFFKCFGCGVGGDAIRFIERIENLPFLEAARVLAKRVGVNVESHSDSHSNERRELREVIYSANAFAAQFYHRFLLMSPHAHEARMYCERRGITANVIERFKLGYAPNGWNGLRDELRQADIPDSVGVQAGLLREGQNGIYDFYRDRLMIPTMAITGETVAFGGRALGNEEPKYLNTSSTPVYAKGKMLFGLNLARRAVNLSGSFILVEGYLDCIALHKAGFEHAVATLGTAFTADQAALLKRFTNNVYVSFDADKAGQSAMLKSLAILNEVGCRARVIDIPAGQDPDSVIQAGGTAAFQALIAGSREAAAVLIDEKLSALDDGFHNQSEKVEAAERIVREESRADWDRWRLYVAEKLGLSITELRSSITLPAPKHHALGNPTELVRKRSIVPPSRERELLSILLEEPALLADYKQRISPHRIRDARLNRLYTLMSEAEQLETGVDVLVVANGDELAAEAMLLLMTPERSTAVRFATTEERREALDRIVEALAREDDERRRRVLREQIDDFLTRGVSPPADLVAKHREVEARLIKGMRPGDKAT
jgi:DNA primase